MIDAAEGVEYLHYELTPPVIHADLKPENLLLDESYRVKLADFGLSTEKYKLKATMAGTPGYLAPEQQKPPYTAASERTDTYSFGVILFELFYNLMPFNFFEPDEVKMYNIKMQEVKLPSGKLPKGLSNLVINCMKPSPELRPSFRQILRILNNEIEDL